MSRLSSISLLTAVALSASCPSVLRGEQLNQSAQQNGRQSFEMLLRRYDSNDDGKISREEFHGPTRFYRHLDADGNGVIEETEFVERRSSSNQGPNGARTLNSSTADSSAGTNRYKVFPAQKPAPGDLAPQIELPDLQGNLVTLSKLLETKPVLIETGSYTCPVFRSRHASIERLHEVVDQQVHLVVLYGKEAHPGSGRFEDVEQPQSNAERSVLAQKVADELSIGVPVLIDDVNNSVTSAYGGLPNCSILVGQDGRVFHKLSWIDPSLLHEPIKALLEAGGHSGSTPHNFPFGGVRPYEARRPQEAPRLSVEKADQGSTKDSLGKRQPIQEQLVQRISTTTDGISVHRDMEYARVGEHALRLDLYLPAKSAKARKHAPTPLLIWIHGGGWKTGDKGSINPIFYRLVREGYAASSINYRLNGLKAHPEHIHDCKGAVRWLRANAEKFGYDATRIGVGGASAGGHLALMLGMVADVEMLEGNIGGNLEQSSRIAAVLDMFGPSDFVSLSKSSSRFRSRHRVNEDQLLSASPLNYLTDDDAPVLIFQGDKDLTVPISQSKLLHERYLAAGLESTFQVIPGAGHGGPQFRDSTRYALAKDFFDRHLKD